MKIHKMRLNPEPFEKISNGSKDIELRLNDKKRQKLSVGDSLLFTNRESGEEISTNIKELYIYSSFEELLSSVDLIKCGWEETPTLSDAVEDMRVYYSEENEKAYGVVGIEVAQILFNKKPPKYQ